MYCYQDKVILCHTQRTQWASRWAGHVQARPMWEGCRTSTNCAWKMSHNGQIFFLDPCFSCRVMGMVLEPIPTAHRWRQAGYTPGRACSPQGPYLSIWTFSALLKGSPGYQHTFHLFSAAVAWTDNAPLLSAAPYRLSYPRKYVLFKITTCFKWQITHDWYFTGDQF